MTLKDWIRDKNRKRLTVLKLKKHKRRVIRNIEEISSRVVSPVPHGLDAKVVVSLTSFAARFENLHLTLKSLLLQTMAADETILWVGQSDFDALPQSILQLQDTGLRIEVTDDIGSYTKLIPALEAFPDAYIVTADDDSSYDKNWLKDLIDAHKSSGAKVVCHRAHYVKMRSPSEVAPYASWPHNITEPDQSPTIFPTGVCGVLYAPKCFDERVLDQAKFKALCPKADDVWFYWMHRLTGGSAQKIGGPKRIVEWTKDPEDGLRTYNVLNGGNDTQIKALIKEFGIPD